MVDEKHGSESSENLIYRFTIPLKLPSLNEYTRQCRTGWVMGAKMKSDTEEAIMPFLLRLPFIRKPVIVHFTWVEPNQKRDCDNVSFAKKFILDALVKAGKLENDNPKHVKGFTDSFQYDKEAKVIVDIEEVEE